MPEDYIEITPQDLSSVLSVLDYLYNWAVSKKDTNAEKVVLELQKQFEKVFDPAESDKIRLPYNRKDYYNILEYLKLQAEQLSEGKWNDFTDSDLGTVFLRLLSYLADMENYQIDKSIAELYLSTCRERASALLLCRLIGYEPRHYMSAETDIYLGVTNNDKGEPNDIPNGTIIPKGSVFTTEDNTRNYTTLEDAVYIDNQAIVHAYEGSLKLLQYKLENITELGRLILPDYAIAFNTVQLSINNEQYTRVENVAVNTGDLAFSVHCSEDQYIYMQLPSFWTDIITTSSIISVSYCISSGELGRVGKDKITNITSIDGSEKTKMIIVGNTTSIEGYNPETIDEIKISAPIKARTMDTIVTCKDFEELGGLIDGIAYVKALDYNDPASGLVQPTPGPGGYVNDAYKVNMYVLPDTTPYDIKNPENNKYRNTIIKEREDWVWTDMGHVAEQVQYFAKASIAGNQITIAGEASTYNKINDIILGVDTLSEITSYLPELSDTVPGTTEKFTYNIRISGEDIIITLCTNWRDFLTKDTDKLAVFFKREQVLTDAGQQLRDYVDHRRLASLWLTYYDITVYQPTVEISVYMDSKNIEFNTIASQVQDLVLYNFSRKFLKPGDSLFASKVGADILDNFDFIKFVDVHIGDYEPRYNGVFEVAPNEFIDLIPPNVIVEAYDYQYIKKPVEHTEKP